MNKSLKIIIGIIFVLIILWGIIFAVDYNMCKNFEMPIFVIAGETLDDGGSGTYYGLGYKVHVKKNILAEYGIDLESVEMYMFNKFIIGAISETNDKEEVESDYAIIKNGNINDENIIETFINKVSNNEESILKIREYKSNNEYIEKKLKYTADGGFSFTINKDENTAETFSSFYWKPQRIIEDETVKLNLISIGLIEVTEYPEICSYSLESSNYNKKFEITYHQRKDMGIKTIVDKNKNLEYDYNICTFGGDVTITLDTDMVYTLDEALKQKVVTVEEILEQAKLDQKYGVCEGRYYKDGGSMEYAYKTHTILKYNTLDGNKDLVFGFSGQIINLVNKKLN